MQLLDLAKKHIYKWLENATISNTRRNDADYWVAKGDGARDARHWDAAAECYNRAVLLDSRLAHIWVQLGHAFKESGNEADAQVAYWRALEIEPQNADTHLQLGHLKKLQGDISGAAQCYMDALRVDKGFIYAVDELRALGLDKDAERIIADRPQVAWKPTDEVERRLDDLDSRLQSIAKQFGNLLSRISDTRAIHFVVTRQRDQIDSLASRISDQEIKFAEKLLPRLTELSNRVSDFGVARSADFAALHEDVKTTSASLSQLEADIQGIRIEVAVAQKAVSGSDAYARQRISELATKLDSLTTMNSERLDAEGIKRELGLQLELFSERIFDLESAITAAASSAQLTDLRDRVSDSTAAHTANVASLREEVRLGNESIAKLQIRIQELMKQVELSEHAIGASDARMQAAAAEIEKRVEISLTLTDKEAVTTEELRNELKLQLTKLLERVRGLEATAEASSQVVIGDPADNDHERISVEVVALRRDFDRQAENSTEMLNYLNGRVEFVRRELMYEYHHGSHRSKQFGDALVARPKIVNKAKLAVAQAEGIRLNIGCGHLPVEGYLNVDRRELTGVDVVAEADNLPFEPGTIEEIRSSHLLEHFPEQQLIRRVLPYWKALLKPAGRLLAIVPDGKTMLSELSAGNYQFEDFREVLFGAQDYIGDYHYNLLTPESLAEILKQQGFTDVKIREQGRRNGKCFEFEIEGLGPTNSSPARRIRRSRSSSTKRPALRRAHNQGQN